MIICTPITTRETLDAYWAYAKDIMQYLFGENMLDKEEVIGWILANGEKLRAGDEFQLRVIY